MATIGRECACRPVVSPMVPRSYTSDASCSDLVGGFVSARKRRRQVQVPPVGFPPPVQRKVVMEAMKTDWGAQDVRI